MKRSVLILLLALCAAPLCRAQYTAGDLQAAADTACVEFSFILEAGGTAIEGQGFTSRGKWKVSDGRTTVYGDSLIVCTVYADEKQIYIENASEAASTYDYILGIIRELGTVQTGTRYESDGYAITFPKICTAPARDLDFHKDFPTPDADWTITDLR